MALWDMIKLSVTAPRDAAGRLLAMRLPAQVGWLGFGLVVVINTFAQALYSVLVPLPEELQGVAIPPIGFAIMFATALILSVIVLAWVGRFFGGIAQLEDVLCILVWLQFLRAIAQLGLVAVAVIIPQLSVIAGLGVSLLGVWLLMNFLNVAFGFDNLWKSFGVMLAAGVFVLAGLIMVMTMILPML
jgi:hypothetical protein